MHADVEHRTDQASDIDRPKSTNQSSLWGGSTLEGCVGRTGSKYSTVRLIRTHTSDLLDKYQVFELRQHGARS